MTKICPHCHRRYSVSKYTVDYVHECDSGKPVFDQDDVVNIGNYVDQDGLRGTVVTGSVQNALKQGQQAKNFGTDAFIEGEETHSRTRRGNRADTRRQRRHLETIEIIKKKIIK